MTIADKIKQTYAGFCRKYNIEPTEIWLGPNQKHELEKWCNEQYVLLNRHGPLILNEHSDGEMLFRGKTIRFMQKDGIRVGISDDYEES